MDDRSTTRPRAVMSEPPGGPPPPPGEPMRPPPRAVAVGRGAAYGRRPELWRRLAAVAVAIILLGLIATWLDAPRALLVWVLLSLFVVLWPNWPPPTPGEERARAWPFEP